MWSQPAGTRSHHRLPSGLWIHARGASPEALGGGRCERGAGEDCTQAKCCVEGNEAMCGALKELCKAGSRRTTGQHPGATSALAESSDGTRPGLSAGSGENYPGFPRLARGNLQSASPLRCTLPDHEPAAKLQPAPGQTAFAGRRPAETQHHGLEGEEKEKSCTRLQLQRG